jgi:hypothetical protein
VAAQGLAKDSQKCINTMNKNLLKVTSTVGKDVHACVKNFGKRKTDKLGPGGTPETCLLADVKGKVAKATTKTEEDYAKDCGVLPPVGVTDPDTVNMAARKAQLFLVRDIFGPDLDAGLSQEDSPAKCQEAALKSALKCHGARVKAYNACKKAAMKAGAAETSELRAGSEQEVHRRPGGFLPGLRRNHCRGTARVPAGRCGVPELPGPQGGRSSRCVPLRDL